MPQTILMQAPTAIRRLAAAAAGTATTLAGRDATWSRADGSSKADIDEEGSEEQQEELGEAHSEGAAVELEQVSKARNRAR